MSTYFVTGSRGFLGEQLCLTLAKDGHRIKAMLRPGSKAPQSFSHYQLIETVEADLTSAAQIGDHLNGVDGIFHLAAFAKPWAKDFAIFYQVNVKASVDLTQLAVKHNVKRMVLTSTAGTFGPQESADFVNESKAAHLAPFTEYERTKKLGWEEALKTAKGKLEMIAVSPTRVFGPGELSVSNAVTKLIHDYVYGSYRFVPGNGHTIGNYVFINDIIAGHVLAMNHGRSGENYILGGNNLSYRELFDLVGQLSGKHKKLIGIPVSLMMLISKTMEFSAKITGNPPKITPPFVRKYTHNWGTDISKAKEELGYAPKSAEEAITLTLNWIKQQKNELRK